MTQTTGNATMLDRMPMMASSGDRLMKPSESPGLTVGGMVLYHMALPTMHKNSRAKQVETLWHLEDVMAIILLTYNCGSVCLYVCVSPFFKLQSEDIEGGHSG